MAWHARAPPCPILFKSVDADVIHPLRPVVFFCVYANCEAVSSGPQFDKSSSGVLRSIPPPSTSTSSRLPEDSQIASTAAPADEEFSMVSTHTHLTFSSVSSSVQGNRNGVRWSIGHVRFIHPELALTQPVCRYW